VAARSLLDPLHRPTALMVATDRNAIGFMGTLTDADLAISRDLAIVAFDNIEADAHDSEVAGDDSLPDASPELLRDERQDVLCGPLLTGDGYVDGPLHEAGVATVRDAVRLL
jgi:Periplasmic binding protein-like domain